MRDAIGFRQQLSMTSFEAFELEITVNYPVHTGTEDGSSMWNLTSWSVPHWLVLLTEHKVLHCYATNVVWRCMVAGQLYTRLVDSSADCRCFQFSNHYQEIHSASFVHHTILTDRDFKSESHLPMKFSWFCLIFTDIYVLTVSQGKVGAWNR